MTGNFLAQLLFFRWKLGDPMSGFFGMKKRIIEKYRDRVSPRGYKFLFTIAKHYIRENHCNRVASVDYVFINRRCGESKLSMNEITDYIKSIFGSDKPARKRKPKKAFFRAPCIIPDFLAGPKYSPVLPRKPIVM